MKTFAVIGYPLKHTLSPYLHNLVFETLELSHAYTPWEVLPEELAIAVHMFRRNLAGFNVTAPYKKTIRPYLDGFHFSAELYESVNTVKNENGRLIGYNTDGTGFLRGLEVANYAIAEKHVLLLGAGGAAQTVALELAHQGCIFTIANREVSRAYQLQVLLEKRFPKVQVEVANLSRVPKRPYQCVINATPVGMGDLSNKTPLDLEYLAGVELVYDLIYNPPKTRLLELAESRGCLTMNGLTMLISQGLQAEEIWLEQEINSEMEKKIFQAVQKELYGRDKSVSTPWA